MPDRISLDDLEQAIKGEWCAETADRPELWRDHNPAWLQCGVTAVVVRHFLGGEILIAPVIGGFPNEHHAWNRLVSGIEVDLTTDQFRSGQTLGEPMVREPIVGDRAELLLRRVQARLGV